MKQYENVNMAEYSHILEAERVTIHELSYYLKKEDMDYDEHGNVLINFNKANKGSVILVSHMDNVLHGEREPVLDLTGRFMMGRKTGIGFDDKAGIIACLELNKRFKGKVRIIFTTDEEVGGISAGKLDPSRYSDAKYMIELDRRNANDLIQYSGSTRLCSNSFADMIEGFGFKRATGTFTDVNKFKAKCPAVEMCNLSIGYYNAHSDNEYLDIMEFNDIIDKVEDIINTCTGTYIDDTVDEPKVASKDKYWGLAPAEDYCENCGCYIPHGTGVRTIDGFLCCDETCKAELEKFYLEDYDNDENIKDEQ